MRSLQRGAQTCWTGACLVLLIGCEKPSAPPGPINLAMQSWNAGSEEEATQILASIDWNSPGVARDAPVLFTLTEQEFMSMWRSRRNRLMTNEVIPSTHTVLALSKHIVSAGQAAQDSGDRESARVHYEAALNLGTYLSEPPRLAVARLVAKALVAQAQEQLTTLERESTSESQVSSTGVMNSVPDTHATDNTD